MKLTATPIAGVYEATTTVMADDRGQFARLFCDADLAIAHAGRPIVQINQSVTRAKGAIRGLHYQRAPHAEGKWIRCLRGAVFDVAVDLRAGSPTRLCWHGVTLCAEAMNAVFIPEGCAHGFQTLEDDCSLLYLHTARYAPSYEGGVRFDDGALAITWPLPVTDMSSRDRGLPLLNAAFEGLPL